MWKKEALPMPAGRASFVGRAVRLRLDVDLGLVIDTTGPRCALTIPPGAPCRA